MHNAMKSAHSFYVNEVLKLVCSGPILWHATPTKLKHMAKDKSKKKISKTRQVGSLPIDTASKTD